MDNYAENDVSFIVSYGEQCWPGFKVTQQLLEHPTSDFVFEFYEHVRNDVLLLLNQIIDSKHADSSFQLKADGDPVFGLLHFINKYMKKLSFGQADCMLTLSDLHEPTAKRTKIRFKVLLNLLVFYEEQVDKIKSIVVKRQTQVEEHIRKKTEKEQLKSELAREAEKLAHSEDELHALQKELTRAELRYTNMQEQKDDSDRRCKKLQHDLKMCADTYQNKQTLLTNIKTNIQHLNEQIVAVEGQKCLLDLKEVLTKQLAELNAEASCAATNLESRKPTIEHFLNVEKQIQNLCYDELKMLQNSIIEVQAQLRTSEPKYKEKIKEVQKLRDTELTYKENTRQNNQILQSEMLRDKILLEQVKQEMKQIKIEEVEEESSQVSINADGIALQKEIDITQQKCAEITTYIENFNTHCGNTYTKILSVENNMTSNFNKVLANVAKAISDAADSNYDVSAKPKN